MPDYVSPFDMNPGNGWDGHKDWLYWRDQFVRGEDAAWAFSQMLFRVSSTIPHGKWEVVRAN